LVTVGLAGLPGAPTVTAPAEAAGPVPELFVALTEQLYVLAVVSPATTIGVADAPKCTALFTAPPRLGVHVAVNFVIGPAWLAPAANETVTDPVVADVGFGSAIAPVGAAGAPTVTALEAGDAVPVPTTFLAATLNV
jgi:hypothetical protein